MASLYGLLEEAVLWQPPQPLSPPSSPSWSAASCPPIEPAWARAARTRAETGQDAPGPASWVPPSSVAAGASLASVAESAATSTWTSAARTTAAKPAPSTTRGNATSAEAFKAAAAAPHYHRRDRSLPALPPSSRTGAAPAPTPTPTAALRAQRASSMGQLPSTVASASALLWPAPVAPSTEPSSSWQTTAAFGPATNTWLQLQLPALPLLHVSSNLAARFVCEHDGCGRAFKHNYELKKHIARHSSERRYVCEFCGSKFKYSSTLGQHRRTAAKCLRARNDLGDPRPPPPTTAPATPAPAAAHRQPATPDAGPAARARSRQPARPSDAARPSSNAVAAACTFRAWIGMDSDHMRASPAAASKEEDEEAASESATSGTPSTSDDDGFVESPWQSEPELLTPTMNDFLVPKMDHLLTGPASKIDDLHSADLEYYETEGTLW